MQYAAGTSASSEHGNRQLARVLSTSRQRRCRRRSRSHLALSRCHRDGIPTCLRVVHLPLIEVRLQRERGPVGSGRWVHLALAMAWTNHWDRQGLSGARPEQWIALPRRELLKAKAPLSLKRGPAGAASVRAAAEVWAGEPLHKSIVR